MSMYNFFVTSVLIVLTILIDSSVGPQGTRLQIDSTLLLYDAVHIKRSALSEQSTLATLCMSSGYTNASELDECSSGVPKVHHYLCF